MRGAHTCCCSRKRKYSRCCCSTAAAAPCGASTHDVCQDSNSVVAIPRPASARFPPSAARYSFATPAHSTSNHGWPWVPKLYWRPARPSPCLPAAAGAFIIPTPFVPVVVPRRRRRRRCPRAAPNRAAAAADDDNDDDAATTTTITAAPSVAIAVAVAAAAAAVVAVLLHRRVSPSGARARRSPLLRSAFPHAAQPALDWRNLAKRDDDTRLEPSQCAD